MPRKRITISDHFLCRIGTLAFNKDFTPRDFREYVKKPTNVLYYLVREGVLERTERGKFYPTKMGWESIEVACGHRVR